MVKKKSSENDENTEHMERIAYSPEDIQAMLGVKRSSVYNFLTQVYKNRDPFLVHKIGSMYRIPKESFDAWFYGENTEK